MSTSPCFAARWSRSWARAVAERPRLLNCLSGLDVIDGGTIKIAGRDLKDLTDNQRTDFRAREMGFVFQTYNLLPVLTGIENVELPMLVGGVKPSLARKRAQEAVEMVGVGEWAGHRPAEMSGGQRQRFTIARALATKPSIVWADEPTGALDTETSAGIMDLMVQLNRQNDQTFVWVTHSEEVGALAQRMIRMRDGLIVSDVKEATSAMDGPRRRILWPRAARGSIEHLFRNPSPHRGRCGSPWRWPRYLLGLLLFAAFNRVLLKMALRNIPRRRAQTVLILFGLDARDAHHHGIAFRRRHVELLACRRSSSARSAASTRRSRVTRSTGAVQGASTADSEFFSEAQAADVIARSKKDSNVAAAAGVIAASGSMIDTTTSQSSSENVAIFGVPADFGRVWGQLHSSSGANLDVATLGSQRCVRRRLAGQHAERARGRYAPALRRRSPDDRDDSRSARHRGQPEHRRPRSDRQLGPDAARPPCGPSCSAQAATTSSSSTTAARAALTTSDRRAAIGDEVTQHFRVEFTDPQAAADLFAFLSTPGYQGAGQEDPRPGVVSRSHTELQRPAAGGAEQARRDRRVQGAGGQPFRRARDEPGCVSSSGRRRSRRGECRACRSCSLLVGVLQVDTPAATELKALLQQPDVRATSRIAGDFATRRQPGGADRDRPCAGLDQPGVSPDFKATVGNPAFQAQLGRLIEAIAPVGAGALQRHRRTARPLRLLGLQGRRRDVRAAGRPLHHRAPCWASASSRSRSACCSSS